jgi:hypothetical protein
MTFHGFGNFHTTTCQSKPRRIYIPGKKMEGFGVGYVNGMLTDEKSVTSTGESVSSSYGGAEVNVYFCPTKGLVNDLIDMAAARLGFYTRSVRFVSDNVKEDADKTAGIYVLPTHSRGCEYGYQALKRLTPEDRQRIIPVGIGGARLYPEKFCFDSYNLISTSDPIPYISSPIESWRAKQGDPRFKVIYYNSTGYWGLDHTINGPTYSEVNKYFGFYIQTKFKG